jgi:DNA-directed RNA polymerase specialized sigma24 family protein
METERMNENSESKGNGKDKAKGDGKGNGDSEIRYEDLDQFLEELKAMARALLAREYNAQSIQTTRLVNKALRKQKPKGKPWGEVSWKNRNYFFGAMRKAMNRILIDHGRARRGERRQAMDHYVPLDGVADAGPEAHEKALQSVPMNTAGLMALMDQRPEEIQAVMESMQTLQERHPDWAAVVFYRNNLELTVKEVARIMDISEATVKRHWRQAMALLADDIKRRLG